MRGRPAPMLVDGGLGEPADRGEAAIARPQQAKDRVTGECEMVWPNMVLMVSSTSLRRAASTGSADRWVSASTVFVRGCRDRGVAERLQLGVSCSGSGPGG